MAGNQQIIIAIDKDGFVKAEVSGVPGPDCKKYLSLIEDIVNGKATDETLTAEYYQQSTSSQNDQTSLNQQNG